MVAGFFSVRGTYSLFFTIRHSCSQILLFLSLWFPFHTVKMLNFMGSYIFSSLVPQKSVGRVLKMPELHGANFKTSHP